MRERDERPMRVWVARGHHRPLEGGGSMKNKIMSIPWRRLLITGATLATMLLAAGARWKPH
jgi:hypothetical protein